jgi:hypothetical protein
MDERSESWLFDVKLPRNAQRGDLSVSRSTCPTCRLYDQLHLPESPNDPRVSDGKRAFVGTYPAPPSIMTPHFTRRRFTTYRHRHPLLAVLVDQGLNLFKSLSRLYKAMPLMQW